MEENEIQRLFGKRVRDFRKRKGLSQDELSEKIGKTPDTVSNIERGFSSTRIKTAASIAKALDVPLKELFDFEPLTPDEQERRGRIEQAVDMMKDCDGATLKGAIDVLEAYLRATSTSKQK